TLTGMNMFIQGNAARLTAGLSLVTAAPAALGLPAGDPAFAVTNMSDGGQNYDLAFDDGFDWNTETGGGIMWYQGKPVASSHTFFGGPWRYVGVALGVDPGGTASPLIGVGALGFTLVETQKVWWAARIIRADGRCSTLFRCDPVIVAV
ncbi:unnamed protein product, partial [marine sediment metagenome]